MKNIIPDDKKKVLKDVATVVALGGIPGAAVVYYKHQKEKQENQNDPIVTLMDGRKVRKSQVPVDVIYINEKGQKVKKVNKN